MAIWDSQLGKQNWEEESGGEGEQWEIQKKRQNLKLRIRAVVKTSIEY